jgi:hypothetical protein
MGRFYRPNCCAVTPSAAANQSGVQVIKKQPWLALSDPALVPSPPRLSGILAIAYSFRQRRFRVDSDLPSSQRAM